MTENKLRLQIDTELSNLETELLGLSNGTADKKVEAIQHFRNLGFPTKKTEDWKYSDVKNLIKNDYNFHPSSSITTKELDSFDLPDLEGIKLYFINGIFHPELSDFRDSNGKIQVKTLREAFESEPELIKQYYAKHLKSDKDGFTAMNTAMANDGVFIHVAANSTFEVPVILRMISDVRHENVGSVVRNLIVVGDNAEVKFAEAYRTIGAKSAFVNAVSEVFVGNDARVDYYKVQNDNDASFHIGTTQVYQENKSYFYAATFTINGGFVRNNLNLILDGEHIESNMYGLYVPNGQQHVDNHTEVDHRKPNSVSNELYKGILGDESTGVFNGKIFVQQIAQKTNAYQNCRNVITSDKASMNTKPQLEIWADDVKCSHGTTTGQLNDEAIFYMRSRGIPKIEAIKLQLLAFAEDVVSQIKIESLRNYLAGMVEEKLT